MVALLEPPRVLRGLLANHGVYGLRSDASTSGSWGLWRDRPSQGELGLRAGTRLTGNTLFLCKAPSPGPAPTTSSAGSHPEPVPHYPRVPYPRGRYQTAGHSPAPQGPLKRVTAVDPTSTRPASPHHGGGSCPQLLPRLRLQAGPGASLCGPAGRGAVGPHPLGTVANKLSSQQPSSPDLWALLSLEFPRGALCVGALAAHAPRCLRACGVGCACFSQRQRRVLVPRAPARLRLSPLGLRFPSWQQRVPEGPPEGPRAGRHPRIPPSFSDPLFQPHGAPIHSRRLHFPHLPGTPPTPALLAVSTTPP